MVDLRLEGSNVELCKGFSEAGLNFLSFFFSKYLKSPAGNKKMRKLRECTALERPCEWHVVMDETCDEDGWQLLGVFELFFLWVSLGFVSVPATKAGRIGSGVKLHDMFIIPSWPLLYDFVWSPSPGFTSIW